MGKIYEDVTELIGKTPILKLNRYMEGIACKAVLFGKLEAMNPAGSSKDRIALEMILDAETKGILKRGGRIIEPTSGNTGIGLAAAAAAKGYKTVFTMPDTMSVERQMLLRAYGAEVVLTDGKKGMTGAIEKAKELADAFPDSWIPSQFENPANAKTHRESTGPEIWEDMDGKVDVFVAGVGTGGTLTGVGEYLKSKKTDIKVVAVEPAHSAVLSGGEAGPHGLMGIGAGFVPKVLNTEVYDQVIPIMEEDAYRAARKMARTEGFLVGISSGAALAAAEQLAVREEYAGKHIVVLLPDSGERYLSTPLYQE